MKYLNIRQERINKGKHWTQEYVGQQVGLTKVAIHDIETGKQKPSYDVLVKLETLFGKDHRYLLAQATDPPQQDYSNSNSDGTGQAKELESAGKGFVLDVETVLDIAADGKLDDPERRRRFRRFIKALNAVMDDVA
jgi:transcriptional regulator with XRE-family HTH domain